jgi:hypothetical protein
MVTMRDVMVEKARRQDERDRAKNERRVPRVMRQKALAMNRHRRWLSHLDAPLVTWGDRTETAPVHKV